MKKTILVSAERGETRVAVLEAKSKGSKANVAELYMERRGRRSIVGNIYKGKVDNVLPGMEAAFVDIGLERNGFLHVDENVLPDGQQAPRRGRGSGKGARINELIKPGQEILVQVVKDPLKTKGARLSMNVSIASNSSFTQMRSAWNVRVAGSMRCQPRWPTPRPRPSSSPARNWRSRRASGSWKSAPTEIRAPCRSRR